MSVRGVSIALLSEREKERERERESGFLLLLLSVRKTGTAEVCFLLNKTDQSRGEPRSMGGHMCVSQDSLVMKPQKKTPVVLRIFVLFFLLISGLLMFLICFEQIRIDKRLRLVSISSAPKTPCHGYQLSKSEIRYVHYPQPTNYRREECACTPVRYFAIISTQRSGSGWFETLLNSHTNISSNGEIFQMLERRSNISAIKQTLDRVYNLDFYTSAAKNECTAAVGLKWMLNQGLMDNYDDIVEYFNRRGIFVIFIFRRNLLRQMVSRIANDFDRDLKQLNGTHKSHVHTVEEAELLARFKPKINVTDLVSKLDSTNEYITAVIEKMKRIPHFVVYYEDVIKNSSVLLDVQNFLGVPQKLLFSRQIKIHRKPVRHQIENWDEVYHALHDSFKERWEIEDLGNFQFLTEVCRIPAIDYGGIWYSAHSKGQT